jgi:pyruvate/2-oxoglutarate dehydrogenase complex dihydrolipoamide acyltransferase (E2) component
MTLYSDNFWAEEMGIDLDELKRESPLHPDQMRANRRLTKQAAEYWARERFLARLEAPAPEATYTPPKKRTVKPKQGKVRRYDFTDQQLEIARRSLSAGDSV